MKIYPTTGIDAIRLGMRRIQSQEVLGRPTLIEKESQDEQWQYHQGLELLFQKEDLYLLGKITITNIAAQLDSKPVIGLNEQELLNNFPYLALEEDFEDNGKNYVCSERELSVWVSDGIVSNVTLFPAYDKTGEIPVWPSPNP